MSKSGKRPVIRLTLDSQPLDEGYVVFIFQGGQEAKQAALIESLAQTLDFCVQLSYCSYKEVPPPIIRSARHIVALGKQAGEWVKWFVDAPPERVSYLPDRRFVASQASPFYRNLENLLRNNCKGIRNDQE